MRERIIIKLSGEALGDNDNFYIPETLEKITDQIKILNKTCAVGIVVGGGNIMRGAKVSEELNIKRTSADYMGMLATVQNAIALRDFFVSVGLETRITSSISIRQVAEDHLLGRVQKHFSKERVVIFAGGLGCPYFTTDTTATQRALEISAKTLIMAKNGVDGVYDKDPKEHSDATRYDTITVTEALEKQLGFADNAALSLAREHSLQIRVVNISDMHRALNESIGTVVEPR